LRSSQDYTYTYTHTYTFNSKLFLKSLMLSKYFASNFIARKINPKIIENAENCKIKININIKQFNYCVSVKIFPKFVFKMSWCRIYLQFNLTLQISGFNLTK